MKKLPEEIINFLHVQGFVIVSTIDKNGFPHSSCKGIVKIDQRGQVYLLDLYRANTYANLKENPQASITAIHEHKFSGYCLKGRAKILPPEKLDPEIIKSWEERITSRLTQRLLKNIREEKGHPLHPESQLPRPQYLIAFEVEEIIDLTPQHLS